MSNPQDIETLTRRYNSLATKKTQAETRLATAKEELAKLLAQAKQEYGTDDLAELQRILEERRAENDRKRAEYQASLDAIEQALKEIN